MSSPFRRVLKERFGVKVITAFIIVIAASFTLYTVVWAVYEIGRLRHKLEDQGIMLTSLLARGAVVGIFTENEAELKRAAADVLKLPDVVSVSLFNAEGRRLYQGSGMVGRPGHGKSPGRNAPGSPAGAEVQIADQADAVSISRPVLSASIAEADETLYFGPSAGPAPERVIGHVLVVMSKESYRGEIAALAGRNVGLMAVFIAVSGIVVWVAVRKVTRPLERLTESVRDFERGVPVDPSPVETADEIGRLASAFNDMVAARREGERSLRESEDRYRRLVELSPDAIYVQHEGKVVFINNAGAALFGATDPAAIVGTTVLERIYDEDRESAMKWSLQIEQDGAVVSLLPVRYLHPGGMIVDAEVAAAPFTFNGRNAVLVIARDVTDRKSLEEMVKEYQRELHSVEHTMSSLESRVEERERHLIAADLHDHVGQNLVASLFKLGLLQKGISAPDALRHLEDIRDLIGQIIQYTRSLTVELSPPVLSEIGFKAAVESLAGGIDAVYGIPVTIKDDGRSDLIGEDVRSPLFRCVRELLMNAVKHSRAKVVAVSLERDNDRIRITVADDGAGFDASTAGKRSGFGLFSIRERMKKLGGSCEIESMPGSGTKVVLDAPVNLGIQRNVS
jgi:PAS domain S-box-containing protein